MVKHDSTQPNIHHKTEFNLFKYLEAVNAPPLGRLTSNTRSRYMIPVNVSPPPTAGSQHSP